MDKGKIGYAFAGSAITAAVLAGGWWAMPGRWTPAAAPEPQQFSRGPVPSSPQEPLEIAIPAEVLSKISLAFGTVTEGTASIEVRVPGTVRPNQYKEVRVSALAGGVATHVPAEIGQMAGKGQPLARIFSRELAEAQSALIAFTADIELEHKKLLRIQDLLKLGAASREELETVEAAHQAHAAHVEQARQQLLLLGLSEADVAQVSAGRTVASTMTVAAPADGLVIERSLNPGQVVAAGQDLFTLTDLSSVWIEGSLFESDFASVRVGSSAMITTPAYPGATYRGVVEYIDPRVDPETRTARVRVAMDNPRGLLRLGMYMDMRFSSGGGRVPIVPKEAIQTIGTTQVVYVPVEGSEGRFAERTIEIAEELAAGYRVQKGLSPGDRVVTEGSFLLRAESLRRSPR